MQYDDNAEKYGYEGEMTPLKCDELQSYKGDVTIPVYGTIADAEVYLKKDVDEAIAELKEFAEDACLERDDNQTAIDELQAENAELKQKLEDVQASMYCDVVDANMEIRRLRRALWISRARSAHNAAMMWEILSDEYLNEAQFTIDFRCIGDPDVTEFQMFRGCMDWMKIYENVERKCRAKAEEYK